MPTISANVSVAANTRSANIVAGESFEFLTRPAIVSLYATGSALGLEADVLIGGRSVAQGADINANNRVPRRDEDGLVQFAGGAGERLFVTLLNTTAGALTGRWIFDINFVA